MPLNRHNTTIVRELTGQRMSSKQNKLNTFPTFLICCIYNLHLYFKSKNVTMFLSLVHMHIFTPGDKMYPKGYISSYKHVINIYPNSIGGANSERLWGIFTTGAKYCMLTRLQTLIS